MTLIGRAVDLVLDESAPCDRPCVEPSPADDLVRRLIKAASAAIANERPALAHRPETVRGLTIELTLTGAGQVHEAIVYLERRTKAGALMSRHVNRRGAG
jgi:hypothetical protein